MAISVTLLIFLIVQVTLTLAAPPLKCLLQGSDFLPIFRRSSTPGSFDDVYKINPPQIEPIKLENISFEKDGLQLDVRQLEYHGFNDAVIDQFEVNFKTSLMRITFHSDILANGYYKFGGSLFTKPINGEGPTTANFKNFKMEIVMPFEIVSGENGLKHINLTRYYFLYDFSNEGEIRLFNLYNGNEEQSNNMHYLINTNLRLFSQQFGNPFMTKVAGHIFTVFRNYMLSKPLGTFSAC